jgi:hypothetical protein
MSHKIKHLSYLRLKPDFTAYFRVSVVIPPSIRQACIIFFVGMILSLPVHAQAIKADSTRPILRPALSPVVELAWGNGTFGQTFGASGWPDGISPLGRDPNRVSVQVDELSLDDLFTARPRFDLIPVAWLTSFSSQPDLGYRGALDSLSFSQPWTLVRYESSGNGSQAVRVLHVQNRLVSLASSTYRLQTAFGYGGEGAHGEYDGSRLKRAREISARIGLYGAKWNIELIEIGQRRSVGAQAGVIPFNGATYSSIYQRLGASVEDENARRRTLRNDLLLRVSTSLNGFRLRVAGVWTKETLDFLNDQAAEKGVMNRVGMKALAEKSIGTHLLSLRLKMENESLSKGTVFPADLSKKRTIYSAETSIEGSKKALFYMGSAEFGTAQGAAWSSILGNAGVTKGPFSVEMTLNRSSRILSWHELRGFGALLSRSPIDVSPIEQFASITLGWRSTLFSIDWTGMLTLDKELLVTREGESSTSASVEHLEGYASSSVSSLVLGFRTQATKGLWAKINPVLRSASTDASSNVALAWKESLPSSWATATLGWKATLFNKDLELNAYARARYWKGMGGLRLHTPTGLLVLPFDNSERVESNWLVDFVAEAGVREATIFISFENAFSGTTALFGNLIVPDYPLPEQRTRFGVYWPISN